MDAQNKNNGNQRFNQNLIKLLGISGIVALFLLTCLMAMPAFAARGSSYDGSVVKPVCSAPYAQTYAFRPGPSTTPLSCGASVSGVINTGETLRAGNVGVKLVMLETHAGTTRAIVDVIGPDCTVIGRHSLNPGETTYFSGVYPGSYLTVQANGVAPGYTFNATWADLTVSRVC